MRKLQEFLGLSAPDEVASAQLSIILHAFGRYRYSVLEQGFKKIFVTLPGFEANAVSAVLRSQADLDKLMSGGAVLIKLPHLQKIILHFDELEDGGEYVQSSVHAATFLRLNNLENNRDNIARGLEHEFGTVLKGHTELAPDKRSLMNPDKPNQVDAEADVVLRLPANDPADDEYVLGSAKTSITGGSGIDQ